MHEKQRQTAKLLQQLEDSKRLVSRKDADLVEAAGRLHSKEEQWEALATEQQDALGKCKKERDDALVQSRGLVEEVRLSAVARSQLNWFGQVCMGKRAQKGEAVAGTGHTTEEGPQQEGTGQSAGAIQKRGGGGAACLQPC
jgi:hypothetical protein